MLGAPRSSPQEFDAVLFNPFASIGRTGTSKGKVKVMVICLNISFMTCFTSFFTPI